jgi:HlyD family secretion protein
MDRKIDKKYWSRQRIGIIAALVVIPSLIAYSIFGADHGSSLRMDADKLSIAEVSKGNFAEYISADGTILPLETVYLDAVEGGVVEKIKTEDGSMVKQGDTLICMSNANLSLDYINRETQILELLNQIENTRVTLKQNEIRSMNDLSDLKYQLNNSELKYSTDKVLAEHKAIAKNDMKLTANENEHLKEKMSITKKAMRQDSIMTTAQLKQMNFSVQRMKENLAIVKKNMEQLIVRAPLTGRLTGFDLQKGQLVQKGQSIAQIDKQGGFKARVQIDEHYISRVIDGQECTMELDGQNYKMHIKKINPQVKNGFFAADLVFDEKEPQGIKKGQNITVRMALSNEVPALLIPRGNFMQNTGGNWVYVLSADGSTAEKRNIHIGRQNPAYYELLDGLKPGEKVIISSYEGFDDKQKLILKQRNQ